MKIDISFMNRGGDAKAEPAQEEKKEDAYYGPEKPPKFRPGVYPAQIVSAEEVTVGPEERPAIEIKFEIVNPYLINGHKEWVENDDWESEDGPFKEVTLPGPLPFIQAGIPDDQDLRPYYGWREQWEKWESWQYEREVEKRGKDARHTADPLRLVIFLPNGRYTRAENDDNIRRIDKLINNLAASNRRWKKPNWRAGEEFYLTGRYCGISMQRHVYPAPQHDGSRVIRDYVSAAWVTSLSCCRLDPERGDGKPRKVMIDKRLPRNLNFEKLLGMTWNEEKDDAKFCQEPEWIGRIYNAQGEEIDFVDTGDEMDENDEYLEFDGKGDPDDIFNW